MQLYQYLKDDGSRIRLGFCAGVIRSPLSKLPRACEARMTILARVYLVRHGETDANRDGIIQGQLNTPLNDIGRKQASLVGEALRDIPFDIAYSSDLDRATDVRFPAHLITDRMLNV